MIQKILSLLNQFVPIGIAMKGLEKVNPKLKSFLGTAGALGYGANEIIGFLREKAQPAGEQQFRSRLQERSESDTARPDEAANLERLNQAALPGNLLQGAAATGIGALGGAGAAGMLSKAGKAAAPVAAAPAAAAVQTGLENFFSEFPQIKKALDQEMNNGSPFEAAVLKVKEKKSLKPLVSAIEKKVGQPFETVISQLYNGFGNNPQNVQQQQPLDEDMSQLVSLVRRYLGAKGG